ncbi:hypothetical protein ACFFRR_006338 [Megaselia abdita]
MSNVNLKTRLDEDIFLYVTCMNKSNFVKVCFRSHDEYHFDLVKEAISAAFEGFNVDDFDFYWDQVLIPDKELVNLIKAKQYCGSFRINLKEKSVSIKVEKDVNHSLSLEKIIKVDDDIIEESFIDEIHQFLDEGNESCRIIEDRIIVQENTTESLGGSNEQNSNETSQENNDSLIDIEEPSEPNPTSKKVLRPRQTNSTNESKNVETEEDSDCDSEISFTSSDDDSENSTKTTPTEKLWCKSKKKSSLKNTISDKPTHEQVNKFKDYIKANLGSSILLVDDNIKITDRKNIIHHSIQYLFNNYGLHSSVGQKRIIVYMLIEIFKPFKDEKQVMNWICKMIPYFRKKSRQEKNKGLNVDSDCEPENRSPEEDFKEQVAKLREHIKSKLGSTIFSMSDKNVMSITNRSKILNCAVKYLFDQCGVLYPNDEQKHDLSKMLVELFKAFKDNYKGNALFKYIGDKIRSMRKSILDKEKEENSRKRRRSEGDSDETTSTATGNSESSRQKLNDQSSKKTISNEPFDVQVAKFKEYFNENSDIEIELLLEDPLQRENRKLIIHTAVTYLIDECGMFPSNSQKTVLVRILIEVFNLFEKEKSSVASWVSAKVRYIRNFTMEKEAGVANLLENAKKRRKLLTGGIEPNEVNDNEESNSESSNNFVSEPLEVGVTKTKQYFEKTLGPDFLLLEELTNDNRYKLINCAVLYLFKKCGYHPNFSQKGRLVRMLVEIFEILRGEEKNLTKWINDKIVTKRRTIRDRKKREEELRKKSLKTISEANEEDTENLIEHNQKARENYEIQLSKFKEYFNKNSGLKLEHIGDPLAKDTRVIIINCASQYLVDEAGVNPSVVEKSILIKMLGELLEPFKEIDRLVNSWITAKVKSIRNGLKKDKGSCDSESEDTLMKSKMSFTSDKPSEQARKFKDYFKNSAKKTTSEKSKEKEETRKGKKSKRVESDIEDDSDCDSDDYSVRTGTDLEISDCETDESMFEN